MLAIILITIVQMVISQEKLRLIILIDFVNAVLQENKNNILKQKDVKDLLGILVDLMIDPVTKVFRNRYIDYSLLREKDIEFFPEKIEISKSLMFINSWKG